MLTSPQFLCSSLSTRFLGAEDVVHLVQRKGLSHCIAGIAGRIEAEFLRWPAFDKTARVAHHGTQGSIELMPIADESAYAFKLVNGHPGNPAVGLPTVMAFGALADMATGAPRLLCELTLTTALRTAATSALAARALARPGSRTLALIGNGAQAEFQALALRDLVGVREVRLFDTDVAAMRKVATHLADAGLRLQLCTHVAAAVRGADIVTTLTADKSHAEVLTADLLEPGMHINAVGGDCPGKTELHPEVLRRAAVFVEYEPQTRIEGDLQQMPADFPVTELWQVLAGSAPGRRDAQQITVFDSVGFALEDYAALCWIRDAAAELGLGQSVALMPALTDPKNLYAALFEPAPLHSRPAAARSSSAVPTDLKTVRSPSSRRPAA